MGEVDIENVTEALKTGPYGRCAYECDNDVADHQVVNFEFASGMTASFNMVATTKRLCERETKIYGSKGELTSTDPEEVRHFDFETWGEIVHRAEPSGTQGLQGHGGADQQIVDAFVKAVLSGDRSLVLTDPVE